MDISKIVKELLYKYDSVAIDGLGSFIIQKESADIKKSEGGKVKLIPPVRKIIFDSNLKSDDGLIVRHIVKKSRISTQEAKAIFDEWLTNIKDDLDKGKSIFLADIGSLKQESRVVVFNALNRNYNTESFGLNTVYTQEVEPVIEKDKEASGVWKFILAIAAIVAIVLVLTKTDLLKSKKQNTNTNTNQVVDNKENNTTEKDEKAAILAEVKKEIEKSQKASEAILAEAKSVAESNKKILENADSSNVKEEAAKIIEESNRIAEETKKAVEETKKVAEEVDSELVKEENKFFIIAGSFNERPNAEISAKKFKKQGYENADVLEDAKRFRVILGAYKTKNDALVELKAIRRRDKDLGIWILSRK